MTTVPRVGERMTPVQNGEPSSAKGEVRWTAAGKGRSWKGLEGIWRVTDGGDGIGEKEERGWKLFAWGRSNGRLPSSDGSPQLLNPLEEAARLGKELCGPCRRTSGIARPSCHLV